MDDHEVAKACLFAGLAWGIGGAISILWTGQVSSLWGAVPTIVLCTLVGLLGAGFAKLRARRRQQKRRNPVRS